jgi:hypothetical protein
LEPNQRATVLFKWLGLVGPLAGPGRGNSLPLNVAAWLQRATKCATQLRIEHADQRERERANPPANSLSCLSA